MQYIRNSSVDIKISDSIYTPKNSHVISTDLRESEKCRILRSSEEPYFFLHSSRIVVRGKVFLSRGHARKAAGKI
ncbi:hypothetical protein Y032_0082g1581 [Ancylostoma ceylanicum]|uniref:Uncharacterized protein n=1 Tax=Ancylostoma ceylanicum TaxID=53326 RepID=A0A016TS13_9BILA|nr:hypothetical protein Y032_0082g1581 [Ancylostoma ceylanicum]